MALLRPIEVFLITTLLFLGLWLWDDYVASLLSLSLFLIVVGILAIASISEWLEPSRVPRQFFFSLLAFLAANALVAAGYVFLFDGQFYWLE